MAGPVAGLPARTPSGPVAGLPSSSGPSRGPLTSSPTSILGSRGRPSAPVRRGPSPAVVQDALARVTGAYRSGPAYGSTFDPDEAASLILSIGGTPEEARALSTKILGESGGDPTAVGDDAAAGYGNTTGLGLWQMTTGVGNDDLIAKYGGPDAMLRPKPNAKAALELYRGGGIGNWYAPSNPPGDPNAVAPGRQPKKQDLRLLRKAGVDPRAVRASVSGGKPEPKFNFNEMFFDPGVSIDEGTQIGPIGGHDTHVHVGSDDPRSMKKFGRIAQKRFGLTVGENAFFEGEAPDPTAHNPTGFHYRTSQLPSGKQIGQAIDVTGDQGQLAAYNKFLARKFGGNPQGGVSGSLTSSGGYGGSGSTSATGGFQLPERQSPSLPDLLGAGGGAAAGMGPTGANGLRPESLRPAALAPRTRVRDEGTDQEETLTDILRRIARG